MTSRRSMATYSERVSRALQFVPGHVGGRVASAQPIRRRGGMLRGPSVGAAGAIRYAEWYFASMDPGIATATIPDADTTAGDVWVAVALVESATWTPPAGWTTLLSGTVTDLDYWVGWLRADGTDDLTFTRSTTTSSNLIVGWRLVGVGSRTPVATAATETSSTSSTSLPTPSGGWSAPWQVVASQYPTVTHSQTTPDFGGESSAGTGSSAVACWYSIGYDPPPSVLVPDCRAGTLAWYTDAGHTIPRSVELVKFALGFA